MEVEKLVRENIKQLRPYTSARGDYLSGILLDANENSFGSSVKDDRDLGLNRYPDPTHNKVKIELSRYLGVSKDHIFCGVGSDEVIDLLIRIFCEPKKDNVVILEPTYGMYKVACDINDVLPVIVSLDESFQPMVKEVLDAVNRETKLIFLCSPNNPTGNSIKPELIRQIATSFQGLVVVDEAYAEFSKGSSMIKEIEDIPNLVLLRTFSKAWGLAGARFGYCIADASVINYLYKIKWENHWPSQTFFRVSIP